MTDNPGASMNSEAARQGYVLLTRAPISSPALALLNRREEFN